MPEDSVHPTRPDVDDTSPSAIEEVLDQFKAAPPRADEDSVNDATGARARMMWNPVTDAGGTPREAASVDDSNASGFHFDLGGALARLSGDGPPADPPAAAAPAAVPPAVTRPIAEPMPVATPPREAPPSFDPAPQAPEPVPYSVEPAAPQRPAPTAPADLFADDPPTNYPRRIPGSHLSELRLDPSKARDPRPAMPDEQSAPAPARPSSVFENAASGGVPTLPNLPPSLGAPTLPKANPTALPLAVEPVSGAPSAPDMTALRSAQMRQSRQQRKGKLFGRIVLAFFLVGGLLAAALVFGRSLLFQNDWDAALTPLVNEVQEARGAEFERAVPLVTLDAQQFGERLRAATIGDAWADRVPEWRALGLATGSITAESVTAALVESRKAFYDAPSDTIYQLEGSVGDGDLRSALEAVFSSQVAGVLPAGPASADTVRFAGVSSHESIATRAVEAFVAGPAAERQPANEALPVPISYELASIEVLGEPILVAAGVDPSTFELGSALPENLGEVLDDGATVTPSALLQPGERSLAEPTALGVDDWSLVWGARLPQTTVDRLVGVVTGDSYRPIDRNGTVCFVSVFQTATDADATTLFAEMLAWAAAAPAESQASAVQIGTQRVQLQGCDPGADFGIAPNTGNVDALIDRQSLRLTN